MTVAELRKIISRYPDNMTIKVEKEFGDGEDCFYMGEVTPIIEERRRYLGPKAKNLYLLIIPDPNAKPIWEP